MTFQVGDLVRANDEAQTYYFANDNKGDEQNSDYNRRSLTLGEVTEVPNESGVRVHDLVNDHVLFMRSNTLTRIGGIIDEPLFDMPNPSYRHF